MKVFDVVVLTDHRYLEERYEDPYSQNVINEDRAVVSALEAKGLKVCRTNWDNPDFDWKSARYLLFRTTWDYFDRFNEFSVWLERVSQDCLLINPKELIYWNIDKHYLRDLERAGIRIPPTIFLEPEEPRSLDAIAQGTGWNEFILKPAVSGAARHTYRFKRETISDYEAIFQSLVRHESMLLQEYQTQITAKGEVAYMVFGGKFSHAVLKRAKPGDFRVQDDFGGTIHHYSPSTEEIAFIEKAVQVCDPLPIYARVDVIRDNADRLSIGEIELIEPELWFRMHPPAAGKFANAILSLIDQ